MNGLESGPVIFADVALARRLERAEGRSNAGFVEERARLAPESGATWVEVEGADAMYDGAGSPLTQTFGLGLFQAATEAGMAELEAFFHERGAEVFHEVSPLADPSLLSLLNERGYRPAEFTSVMVRPIHTGMRLAATPDERLRVRLIGDEDQELWVRTSVEGWSEFAEIAGLITGIAEVNVRRADTPLFLAELDGKAIATGAMNICEGVALLAGASTIPEGRRRGAQTALLEYRLRYAAERGCDLAMMCALPGSASQRNAERQGFRIVYTRIKWHLAEA